MSDLNRYEELKAKSKSGGGFFSLTPEEQAEYKTLKPGVKGKDNLEEATEPAVPKLVPEEDRISRLEKMVEKLSAENSNLRQESAAQQEGFVEYKPVAERNKTATIKIYRKDAESPEGVIIKAVVFKDNEFNEETHKYDKLVYNITVKYGDGKDEILKIDAMEFAKLREIEKVEIIKEDRKVLRKVEDYVPRPDRDKDGYPKRILGGGPGFGQSIGSGQVPLEVFIIKSTVTIKRRDGQEIEMSNDYLNM